MAMLSLAVLLVASSCLVAGASGLHITWLPLGDSITWGCGNGVLPHFEPPGCRARPEPNPRPALRGAHS